MIYLLILVLIIVTSFLGIYLEFREFNSKKAKIIMNLLYTILFIVILIPFEVVSVFSRNPFLIIITFGTNIVLGAEAGIFLKKLQEILK